LRAFGQYSMQISDPKRFVDQIVGTQGLYSTGQIEDYLRNAIISRLTDVLGENMKSIFDLPQLFDEISAGMRAKVQDDFTAMGIALKQFMVVSINPTEETAKAIDERSSMGAIGDVDKYMKYKTAQAVGDAAKSGGGTSEGLGLGAGIGMGAGMAGMITNAMSTNQQPQQPVQPTVPATAGAAGAAGVMTLEEAADYLKVAPADVEAIITSGELKARKIGTQYRISKEAIDAYLAG
jgi:excisionase family DNA binding protein